MKLKESEEIHLCIIWDNAREKQKEIIEDIDSSFVILDIFEIEWSKSHFSENLSRFYGQKLPAGSGKQQHIGDGKFLLIIFIDRKPMYKKHKTSRGKQIVNSNTFLAKNKHREYTGGGHKVHATNSVEETSHDLMLLLGLDMKEYISNHSGEKNLKIKALKQDVIGASGWKDIEEIFTVLNTTAKYVVLRNYSQLPTNYYAEKHGDIDLLVDDYEEVKYLLNASSVFNEDYRVHVTAKVNKEDVFFDLRHLNDGYYDSKWEKSILVKRLKYRGFFVPSDEDHYYSLMYHALVHKLSFSADYKKSLKQLSNVNGYSYQNDIKSNISELAYFMSKKRYKVTLPNDKSVLRNTDNIRLLKRQILQKKLTSRFF